MVDAELVLGLVFGSIGVGYFIYGRRQGTFMPFVSGLALMAFPYFVEGALATVLVGLVIASLPFVIKT